MSKLPPLPHWCEPGSPFAEQMQAYATAATEPLLQRIAHLEATASANYGRGHADAHSMLSERIAELEQRNSDLHEDVQRFKKHALNEKAARLELERQLEEARKDAERWLWWRKRWSAMCTESCARRAGIDLSNVYVQSPEQMDFVTDAAMQKGQS